MDRKRKRIRCKLPTYDFRATDYCYGSKSVLGDMYKEYTKHLTTWATLNEDRKLVSNGGNGGLLDEDLMKYKQLYFNKLEQKEGSAKKYAEMELLKNKIKEMYESYQVVVKSIVGRRNFKDLWHDIIDREIRLFKAEFPDLDKRRLAAIQFYEYIQGRMYISNSNNKSIQNCNKYAFHVCTDELCQVKAETSSDHQQLVVTKGRIPPFMNLFCKYIVRETREYRYQRDKNARTKKERLLLKRNSNTFYKNNESNNNNGSSKKQKRKPSTSNGVINQRSGINSRKRKK